MSARQLTIPPKFAALQKAASKDATRPNINGVYFNESHAYATNGHILVARKKEGDLPMGEIHDMSRLARQPGKGGNLVGSSEPIDGIFPRVDLIVDGLPDGENNCVRFTLSAELIRTCIDAMALEKLKGSRSTPITFTVGVESGKFDGRAVKITSSTDADVFGAIMPMRDK